MMSEGKGQLLLKYACASKPTAPNNNEMKKIVSISAQPKPVRRAEDQRLHHHGAAVLPVSRRQGSCKPAAGLLQVSAKDRLFTETGQSHHRDHAHSSSAVCGVS